VFDDQRSQKASIAHVDKARQVATFAVAQEFLDKKIAQLSSSF